jgi:hypothetical protein
MLAIDQAIRTVSGTTSRALPDELMTSIEPLVLKGLVREWPVVQAALESADAVDRYLRRFYRDATVGAFVGDPGILGRVFYNDDMSGFNYQQVKLKLDALLDLIGKHRNDAEPPSFYLGSTTLDTCLPGFRDHNDVDFGEISPLASIWLGNRTRIAAHYDLPHNLACCAAGHRRFTVFPPDQLENLYVGPLDFTPAGQPISLVDFHNPDYARFPKFEIALQNARVADLEPGDAIFVPGMWWHHVESLDSFNVLINYWWRQSPPYMGPPIDVLMHAFLNLRDLPDDQRKAWHGIFKHYIFEASEDTAGHIPEHRRGVLAPGNERLARELRAQLINKLNR